MQFQGYKYYGNIMIDKTHEVMSMKHPQPIGYQFKYKVTTCYVCVSQQTKRMRIKLT